MKREREMRPAVTEWLRATGHTVVYETSCVLCGTFCDVVAARFGERTGRLLPCVDSCIAVELKLSDVAGVIRQAAHNRFAVQLSYAAMPWHFVQNMRPTTLEKFRAAGVGLLAIGGDPVVKTIVQAVPSDIVITNRLKRQLWRRRLELQPTS